MPTTFCLAQRTKCSVDVYLTLSFISNLVYLSNVESLVISSMIHFINDIQKDLGRVQEHCLNENGRLKRTR